MSRDLIIAILASILIHGGLAGGGYFFKKKAAGPVVVEEVPTIALDLPPPPEPEEPEIVENVVADTPTETADLAPPMQQDVPTASVDSPFQQTWKPTPPQLPSMSNPLGAIPPSTRPSVGTGKSLGNVFDLAQLDQGPVVRVRVAPVYPFEMRRSGLKGKVIVRFLVDHNGNVSDPEVLESSNPAFEDSALQAILKWKFKPGKKDGVPVGTRMAQPMVFTLDS